MRYASSAGGRLVTLLGGLIAAVIASIAIPKIFIEGMLDIKAQPILVGAMLVILGVAATLTIVRVVSGNVVIETTPMTVTVRQGLSAAREWPRMSTAFTGTVGKGQGGTTRTLTFATATERVDVECRWFNDAKFTALMNDVTSHQVSAPVTPPQATPPQAI